MVEIKNKILKNSFKIDDIEVYALKIPLKNPIKMTGITVHKLKIFFEKLFLKMVYMVGARLLLHLQ